MYKLSVKKLTVFNENRRSSILNCYGALANTLFLIITLININIEVEASKNGLHEQSGYRPIIRWRSFLFPRSKVVRLDTEQSLL